MKLKGNRGNLAALVVVVACSASVVRGDLVTFSQVGGVSPVSVGSILEVDAVLHMDSVTDLVQMEVFLDAPAGSLDFGSGNTPDYGYHAGFLAATAPNDQLSPIFSLRRVEFVGGAFGGGGPVGPVGPGSLPVGTFAIDTTGMVAGMYNLKIEAGLASFTRPSGELELPLFGTPFTFEVTSSVVPAPGAFLLGAVGLGFVGWFRRRTA